MTKIKVKVEEAYDGWYAYEVGTDADYECIAEGYVSRRALVKWLLANDYEVVS